MNLKDTIRAEVRIELKKLEVGCRNMGSLLHSLGIQVDGWPNPSPQEVGWTSCFIFDFGMLLYTHYALIFAT